MALESVRQRYYTTTGPLPTTRELEPAPNAEVRELVGAVVAGARAEGARV